MRALPVAILMFLAAVSAACSSSARGDGAAPAQAKLVVHVTLSGGPMRPDGRMALSDSPDVGDRVTVTGAGGRTWSARVGRDGDATLTLPAGGYRVTSATCGAGRRVAVQAGATARPSLPCDVPRGPGCGHARTAREVVPDVAGRRFPADLDTISDPELGEWLADAVGSGRLAQHRHGPAGVGVPRPQIPGREPVLEHEPGGRAVGVEVG